MRKIKSLNELLDIRSLYQMRSFINSDRFEHIHEEYWHSKNDSYKEKRVKTKVAINFHVGDKSKAKNWFKLTGVKYNKPKQSNFRLTHCKTDKRYSFSSLKRVWEQIEWIKQNEEDVN